MASILVVTSFAVALQSFGVFAAAAGAVSISRDAAGCLRDRRLPDEEKERAMRAASLSLFRAFLSIVGRSTAAIAASSAVLLVFHVLGLAPASAVARLLATWQGIALASIVMTAIYLLKRKR